MPSAPLRTRFVLFGALLLTLRAAPCHALDKQGSAHGGSVEGPETGMAFSGSALLGAALYNPSYAARPDNTGLALGRFAAHADLDLVGHRLSIPLDANFFTDQTAAGLGVLNPTEFDFIGGVTSATGLSRGTALELGIRYERDMPLDRGTYIQQYADARLRLLFSLGEISPYLRAWLSGTNLNGALTFGVFAFNPTYAARPDNTGLALFRLAGHAEWSLLSEHLVVIADATFFTDRERAATLTELDWTLGLSGRFTPFELGVAYEHDMPLDRSGLIQQFVFSYLSYTFEVFQNQYDLVHE